MRLPNNYGTVYKLKGNRRRPWIARKQMGDIVDYATGRVKRLYKTVGYYTTKGEAIAALGAFNDVTDPSQTHATITVRELYDRWSAEHYQNIKNPKAYRGAFAMLKPLWDEPFESLKLDDIIVCLAKSGKSETMKAVAKSILMQMSDYGMIHELIQNDRRGILRHIPVGDRTPKITRRIFTTNEIERCWQFSELHDDIVLILLYTGVRVSELLALTANDVDWSAQCFHIRQAKTKAGVRTAPIADKIMPLMRQYIAADDRPSYGYFYKWMVKTYDHRPHDTRHTFTTMCVEAGVDQRIIDAMVGHASGNISLSVYTHITSAVMVEAVNRVFNTIC